MLVVVDQFSKWVECYALSDHTAEWVARTMVSAFIGRFGCPLELHSDQGRNFESRMFKEVCDLLKIVKTRTTPYRPSANGQVERMNRTILQILRCFIQGQQEDLHLATVGMAIRSTVNCQTGFTPNFLMLGREVLQPIDLMLNPGGEEEQRTPGTYAARHRFTYGTDESPKTYADVNKFIDYCMPKKNLVYERFVFNTCNQNQGQTIDSYVTELRTKAQSCEYDELKDLLIRDRIVVGTNSTQLQEKMLQDKKSNSAISNISV